MKRKNWLSELFSVMVLGLVMVCNTNSVIGQDLEVQGSLKIVDGTQGDGKILTSDSNGLASWTSPGYSIGDMYKGGIIFYLDVTRQHGLIAKVTDEDGTYIWTDSTASTGSFADGPFGGSFNARMIFQAYPNIHAPAANACKSVSVGALTSWYLPSRYELYLMYMTIGPGAPAPNTNIGNFALEKYWSSTEFQENQGGYVGRCCAHFIDFVDGKYNEDDTKFNSNHRVRAIHAF